MSDSDTGNIPSASTRHAAKRARQDLSAAQRDELSGLRRGFFKRARQEATRWGSESVDLAWTYYPQSGRSSGEGEVTTRPLDAPRLVTDRVHLPRVGVSTLDFIGSVKHDWWPARRQVSVDQIETQADELTAHESDHERESELKSASKVTSRDDHPEVVHAICGFYARFICASGFTLVIELNAAHIADPSLPPTLWRVDGRAEGVELTYPEDEGDCYDQLGGYLDLRVGWAWLTREALQHKALITAEVEPGYLIGVRPGDPLSEEDPAEREDPDIEVVFSRFDAERFDTLEFINIGLDVSADFMPERFSEWLDLELSEPLQSGQLEAFVLSRTDRFIDAIEDLAERRKVEVERCGSDDAPAIRFVRGPLSLTRELSHPYLWTLYSGLQHHEGASQLFREDLDSLYLASELYFEIRTTLSPELKRGEMSLEIDSEQRLVIWRHEGVDVASRECARVSLLDWSAERVFEGAEGARRFLSLWGWREEDRAWHEPRHPLDTCPLCERSATVIRALRSRSEMSPERTLGAQIDAPLPDHMWGYYALRCERHITPIFWERPELIKRALSDQTHRVIDVKSSRKINISGMEVELLWGEELAGSLLNVEVREALRERGGLYAYAFTADLIALSYLPLERAQRDDLTSHISAFAAQMSPRQGWSLGWQHELR